MLLSYFPYFVLLVFAYQFIETYKRSRSRTDLYKKALFRARKTGKKLLVIGDPDNGVKNKLFKRDYGFGDECLDLTGCPNAPPGVTVYKGMLEDLLPKIDLSKRVVFISCVLEQVDDIDSILNILNAMDKRDLFMLNVNPYTIEAWWYPNFLTGEPSIKRRVFYDGEKIYYKPLNI